MPSIKITLVLLPLILLFNFTLHAAYLTNVPTELIQTDGTKIKCFESGDEYYNYLHDKGGYTIIQDSDGFYYFAILDEDKVVASTYRVDSTDPKTVASLKKRVQATKTEYKKKNRPFLAKKSLISYAPTKGTVKNISIFIRFKDEDASIFSKSREHYDDLYNNPEGPSLRHYYQEQSFGALTINTTHYPLQADQKKNCSSYQDPHVRGYYQRYNESTNPGGYSTNSQRASRERTLLKNAVDSAKKSISPSINLDIDGDKRVDYVSLNISGGSSSDIFRPHMWRHASYLSPFIDDKYVSNYIVIRENQLSVLCHEFGHSIGAPDMYAFSTNHSPAGGWDIMGSTHTSPPIHMSTYTRFRYGKWIDDIPLISEKGIYTLDKSSVKNGRCYRINSPNSLHQYFVVEFRTGDGIYNVMKTGMIIWRVDTNFEEDNKDGPPFELYVYRAGGTTTEKSDPLYRSDFSVEAKRTEINDDTDPSSFLNDGSPGGLDISEISSAAGETMTFRLNSVAGIDDNNKLLSERFSLGQNTPNPFKNKAKITFSLGKQSVLSGIKLVIYNLEGEKILSQDYKPDNSSATTHSFMFDGSELNSGIYYYNLLVNGKKLADSKILFKN